MRTFAAVWPPDEVLDHLDLTLATVRGGPSGRSSDVRWSARETWHLTTAFYGDVPDGLVPDLVAGLGEACAALDPYPVGLRGAGVFSHRTLWVGAGGDLDAHQRVVRASREAGESVGAQQDARVRERPHLTIGRARPGSGPPRRRSSRPPSDGGRGPETRGVGEDPLASLVRALAVYEGPRWTVDEVRVVESMPGAGRGGGPLYRTVERLPLRGAGS
ncbi:2'-5' RNA ligase family protein [Cellulomonas palmilytica]|uniref:2'-5' RNA ligase family protein n=1 Tax=Cellulomonas palmilytica TaxID=2608402 RepID=UPI001F297DDF|nr:2'-5' RNA ligase family protein [Cellulomonas palmilytica]UJP38799.1 2'-5' RNA ligase family protein [Cellulomonas palmilytica]